MIFAERLRELRERAGLTQEALASTSGMSIGTIRNYEQGIREPYWRGLFQLTHALGVGCDAFKDCIDASAQPEDKPAASKPAKKTTRKKGDRKL